MSSEQTDTTVPMEPQLASVTARTVEEVPPSVVSPSVQTDMEAASTIAAKQLTSVSALNATLAEKVMTTDAKANTLLAENKLLAARAGELKDELENAQSDIKTLEGRSEALEKTEKMYRDAAAAADDANKRIQYDEMKIDQLRQERKGLGQEIAKLRDHVSTLKDGLDKARSDADEQRQGYDADVENKTREIHIITQQKDDEHAAAEALKRKIADKEDQVAALSDRLGNALSEKEKAQREGLERAHDAEDHINSLKGEVDVVRSELEQLKKERDAALDITSRVENAAAALADENEKLKEAIARSQNDAITAKNTAIVLERDRDATLQKLDEEAKEKTQIASDISELRNERNKLSTMCRDLENRARSTIADAEAKGKQLHALQTMLDSISNERNILAEEKAALEREYNAAQNRANALSSENTFLKNQREDLSRMVTDLDSKASQARHDAEVRAANIDELKGRLDGVEHSLALTGQEKDRLAEEKARLANEKDQTHERVLVLDSQNTDLADRVKKLEEEKRLLGMKINQVENEKKELAAIKDREHHELMAEKEKDFQYETAVLKTAMDNVMNRHVGDHADEAERQMSKADAADRRVDNIETRTYEVPSVVPVEHPVGTPSVGPDVSNPSTSDLSSIDPQNSSKYSTDVMPGDSAPPAATSVPSTTTSAQPATTSSDPYMNTTTMQGAGPHLVPPSRHSKSRDPTAPYAYEKDDHDNNESKPKQIMHKVMGWVKGDK